MVGDVFEGRKQVAAAFGGGEGGGRGGGADQCGDFLALTTGRTHRRHANEFWVEEVPGSNPTSRGS